MMSSLMPQHTPAFTPSPMTKKRPAVDSPFATCTKRHRPNLTHGFSGLSINHNQPYIPDTGDESDSADDLQQPLPASDLAIEEVDAASSTSSSDDSDATFRTTRPPPRRRRPPQQPDVVEDPLEPTVELLNTPDPDIQDMTAPFRPKKRREPDDVDVPGAKRRRQGDMDIDEEIEEIPRPSMRTRTRTEWYEPEKDRIVITSLGSPSSSRSSSRSNSPEPRQLSQPGSNGFTLHPSLLTHLLNTQRHDVGPMPFRSEQSLVLYRPLGLHPDSDHNVVKQWNGEPIVYDSERFEELDDGMEEDGHADEKMDVD